MTKIDLSVPPYFDDFNENKKFYKILFRPGRAVQTRELNQLQSILQNQVARLGGFKQGDLVHPEHTMGVRFFNTTTFVKVPQSQTSLTLTKTQIEEYWLNQEVQNEVGVKGTVSGYSFSSNGDNSVRLYIDLSEASKTTGQNNFKKGDLIKSGSGVTERSARIENTKYSVGRICKIKIPKSIYFFNEHFVLVDEQVLFLEPDNAADDSAWNTYVTCQICIKMVETIVNYANDESLLDNATGTPNFGGIGADRLRIEGTLVKRVINNEEQNLIKLLVLQNGTITDAPLITRESLGLVTDSDARRTYEESGNYTISPFIAEAREFLDDGNGNRGIFSELNDLSFGWDDDDAINEDIARENAAKVAKDVFKLLPPKTFLHTNNRYYPGSSYDTLNDATSFKSLCDSMFGIQVEPGKAYVYGYPVTRVGVSKIGVKKARTSDIEPTQKIETPTASYMLVTNVFGAPEFNTQSWSYDDIELHSKIIDLSVNTPDIPDADTKIGTARVATMSLHSGEHGSKNAEYKLSIFDLKLNEGATQSDIKSIYSASKSTDGKTFLANLVLKDSKDYPNLIFTGTIEHVANPYSVTSTVGGTTISLLTDKTGINIDFQTVAGRDEAFSALSLGTCVQFNTGTLSSIITSVKKIDSGTGLTPTADSKVVAGPVTEITLNNTPTDDTVSVKVGDTGSTTPSLLNPIGSVAEETPGGTIANTNNTNATFTLAYAPIETQTNRVLVKISNEELSGDIDGINRVFSTSNFAISTSANVSAVVLYKISGTDASNNNWTNQQIIPSDDYSIVGSKITFKVVNGVSKAPALGTRIRAEYFTNIASANAKSITLSFPPRSGSSLKAKYQYYTYTVNNKTITLATEVPAGKSVTVNYTYQNTRRLELKFDSKITEPTISKIKVIRKVRGVGTTWVSSTGQFLEKGDWVKIGTGSTAKIYQVYSTPINDNELNLDPDPLEKQVVDNREVLVNAPWSNGTIMTYLTARQIVDTSSQSNCGLIYKLPHTYVRTIRGGTKNAPNPTALTTTYESRRFEVKDTSGGNITLNARDGEYFPGFSNLYHLVDLNTGYWFKLNGPDGDAPKPINEDDPTTFTARVTPNTTTDNSGVKTSNVKFEIATKKSNGDSIASRKVAICAPVIKSAGAATEGTKKLQKGTFNNEGIYSGEARTVSNSDVQIISLGKADVLRITRIVCADDGGKYQATPTNKYFDPDSTLVEGTTVHKNITGAYIFDNGQTDNYYGIAKVTLRPGFPIPQGQVRVEFDYFTHSDAGDYFTVDSYTNSGAAYDDIPQHISQNGDVFDLKRCFDFRPRVNDASDSQQEVLGHKKFRTYKEIPFSSITCSYHVYEERKDRLYISKDGDVLIKEGTPALSSAYPSEADDGMTIYKINIEPYTSSAKSCVLEMVDNKRYTMRDIGKLEKRIKNLENITSLSFLEKDTKELVIKDALGQDKFKHGFMTDTFENPSIAAITHEDFDAAFDTKNSELKPCVQNSAVSLFESVLMIQGTNESNTIKLQNDERKQRNYTSSKKNTPNKKSSLYTLDYENVTFIEQPLCSRVININPFAVQSFVGFLKISPWTDTWRETEVAEPLIIQDNQAYDLAARNFNSNKTRIDWGLTQQTWTGTFQEEPKENGKVQMIEASLHWPVKDGTYLKRSIKKDETGIPREVWEPHQYTKAELKEKPNTYAKIPDGYPGAGQYVKLAAGNAKLRKGYDVVRGTTGFEYRTGIKNTLVDLGFSEPVVSEARIVDINAAQFIRSNEIEYEGRGFFPNTQLYAYFDGVDVTRYCYPDPGYGTVAENENNIVLSDSELSFKFDLNSISTTDATTLSKVAGLTYAQIADPNGGLDFAVLTGEVTTDGTTLVGSYSKLENPSGSAFTEFSVQVGDTLRGHVSKAEGIITEVSTDKKIISFDATSETKFSASGEPVFISNNKIINVKKEILSGSGKVATSYTLANVPISVDATKLILYLYDATPANQIHYELPKNYYEIKENSKTITFVNGKTPVELYQPPNASNTGNDNWQVRADYSYVGSNYTVTNELAVLDTAEWSNNQKALFTIKYPILSGTLPSVTVNGDEVADSSIKVSTSGTTIEILNWNTLFPSPKPAPTASAVRVTYTIAEQQITAKQTNEGTKFKSELDENRSVIIFANGVEKQITTITNNARAVMSSALTTPISVKTKCADKLEALQTKYKSKFVDISNASHLDRNILNKQIQSMSYSPESSSSKLQFVFDKSLLMPPIDSDKISLVIKKEEIGKNAKTRSVTLKCSASGKIKGRFCIPDPKVTGNPKFRTGDKVFRLTNSIRNESSPSVSRADAGYSATGWVDTKRSEIKSVRQFRIVQDAVSGERTPITLKHVFEEWGEVCPADPVAQSFTVVDKDGIFITAVDVFFYSKDPNLPVRLQIRPLADGGMPSSTLLYEMSLESNEVVVNKVDLKTQTVTVHGATAPDAQIGFNKGPWNTEQSAANGIYNVTSYAYDKGLSSLVINDGQSVDYSFGTNETIKNAQSYMIPTRFVLEYPLYLEGNKKNYCFVLLTDSIPKMSGTTDVLEDTYQVYFAQTGKANLHQELATPVHRQAVLEPGEDDLNFILGTSELITSIPQSDGQLFKSQNGISWVGDPVSDLKYKIHKAKFNIDESADIVFVNETLSYVKLPESPFSTVKGSSLVRVQHPNHGFSVGDKVSFYGIDGESNGIMPQQIIEPRVHEIKRVRTDYYIIDLGSTNQANITANFGGPTVRASTNIRFEEIQLITQPLEISDASITWRLSAVSAAAPDADQSDSGQFVDDIQLPLNQEFAVPRSLQVCSSLNEDLLTTSAENQSAWSKKSLKVIATLSSRNENISPVIDAERLGVALKTVQLDKPEGVGYERNINEEVFDTIVILPSELISQPTIKGKIFFSDTDNSVTGSSFILNNKTITGIASLFTVELSVGDKIKNPTNSEVRTIVDILSDTELSIDSPFNVTAGANEINQTVNNLTFNPRRLKFKTADKDIALALDKIHIGKYLSISGTLDGKRDFYQVLVTNKRYTPTNTEIDPQLAAPKLCELEVDHVLPNDVAAGFEFGYAVGPQLKITMLDAYIDAIAPGKTSSASKYVSRPMVLANEANTLKILFDGCRPDGSEILLYYKTIASSEDVDLDSKPWTKLDYSVENNSVLTYATPPTNPNHESYNSYEANALYLKPFIMAQIKIVLRGEDASMYPKIRNLRILSLEE